MQNKRKRLLLVAFHYPPVQGSTGVIRSLAFSRYLRDFGWDVQVLTAATFAYEKIRSENLKSIPDHVKVARAWALDSQKHLSIGGKYSTRLASPDRWQSWICCGFVRAAMLMLTDRPDAVMSTYPIASAHCLGLLIHRAFGIPWLADFRDPMAQDGYPADPRLHKAYRTIESATFKYAQRVTVTTKGAAELYASRYPNYPKESLLTIANGYDDNLLLKAPVADHHSTTHRSKLTEKLVFLHSGLLYPSERDPTAFFEAVSKLKREKRIHPARIEFRFRAAGHEEKYRPLVESYDISDCISFLAPISYDEAIEEMLTVDAFLLFQASNCNQQIPAKIYEYLALRKPIFALTDPVGDTGQLLASLGVKDIIPLDSVSAIATALPEFMASVATNSAYIPSREQCSQFSRKSQTALLAATLDAMATS